MTAYQNGQKVPYGMYFSKSPIDLRFVGGDGEALEGRRGATYQHVPTPLAIALAPVLGGIFVIAFPVVIFVAALRAVWEHLMAPMAQEHAYLAQARFAPAASYLKGTEQGEPAEGEELAEMKAEVEERRERE